MNSGNGRFLNTNTSSSNRLIPAALIWKPYTNGKLVIKELRPGFNAELCGLRKGMEILLINDMSVATAMGKFFPHPAGKPTQAMMDYAANMALARQAWSAQENYREYRWRQQRLLPGRKPNKNRDRFWNIAGNKEAGRQCRLYPYQQFTGQWWIDQSIWILRWTVWWTPAVLFSICGKHPAAAPPLSQGPSWDVLLIKKCLSKTYLYCWRKRNRYSPQHSGTCIAKRNNHRAIDNTVSYWTASMGEGMAIGFDAINGQSCGNINGWSARWDLYIWNTGTEDPFPSHGANYKLWLETKGRI